MTELPWEEIIERLRNQDKLVIQNLYRSVFPKVLNYIEKNGGRRQLAEDVFQDALIALFKNAQNADFQVNTSITQYLFAVCKYTWIKNIKKNPQKRGTFSLDEALIYEDIVEETLEADEKLAFMNEKIQLLSDDCIKVLTLFFEGFSMDEIAEKMGYGTKAYARKRKYKCKERLIAYMKSDPRYQELLNDE